MFKDRSPKGTSRTVHQARQQRRTMSLPEVLLWQVLRRAPKGLKFRRQHPTGPYSLDFYCIAARLAMEVDGTAHEYGSRPVRDSRGDAWLEAEGIGTLRIPASELLQDLDAVVRAVLDTAHSRLPLHRPARRGGPPSRAKLGED
ncbi:very-short-patch-repair endonuclease [Sphingomonas xinjiangensis]|uniref:Very-short-patch-repair endonuclease n=2 Tax=Sphingomonas xinjiangensis TaxID=643568 RepID=A0A840Y875_9SPHN|nr:endonuclease domain-containing protein [Sphingomonas xinjiangensis]MBB5709507.1 very-short-patch-repair endonuclease [Sphingomonas xinjiangensis]